MKVKEMAKKFEAASEGEFLEFDRVTGDDRTSNRPDIVAFALLDRLVPGKCDMVSAAEHDEIFLDVDPSELARVVTDEQKPSTRVTEQA